MIKYLGIPFIKKGLCKPEKIWPKVLIVIEENDEIIKRKKVSLRLELSVLIC